MNWAQQYSQGFRGLSKEIWILSLVMLINRAGAMVIPFMTIYLTDALDFSTSMAGVIVASYGVGSIGGTLLGGVLADRFSYKKVQFFSLAVSGLLFLVMSQCTTIVSLVVIIALTSFAADVLRPANMACIRLYSTEENRTRSLALQRLAINLGFGIGPAIGGFLAHRIGFGALFVADAVTCMMAAMVLLAYLPKDKVDERYRSEADPEKVVTKRMNPKFWLIVLSAFFYAFAFLQMIYTFPVFLDQAFGWSEDKIGWILALNGLLIFVIEMPIVSAIEKHKNKFRILYVGLALQTLAHIFLIPAYAAPMTFCLIYMILLSVGEIFYLPFIASLALNMSHPQRVGRNMALFSVGFGMAHILGPSTGLWVAEHAGFTIFWALTIPFYLVVFWLTWLILRPSKGQSKAAIT